MDKKQYILDRIEKDTFVFLLREDESQQLLLSKDKVTLTLQEGDIITIDGSGSIEVLKDVTEVKKEKVQSLIEKLKNKK